MLIFRLSLLAGFLLTAFLPYPLSHERDNERKMEVVYHAKVNLNGKTNVNTFACYSPKVDNSMWVKMSTSNRNNQLEFEHPSLKIPVKELDCGGRIINKDLQETLKSDQYPYIQIRLESARLNMGKNDNGKLKEAMALTCISIGCVERCMDIPVAVSQTNDKSFQFVGSVPLSMTDFGLVPPTAMMGMIQTRDEIEVSFEMVISLKEENK